MRLFTPFLIAFLLVAPLPSMGGSSQITVTVPADIISLDKLASNLYNDAIVSSNILDRLLQFDKQMRLVPMLALSYRTVGDRTWEFKLRQNVRFHNGEPFDARAVQYTVERTLSTPRASLITYVRGIVSVEAPDPYTVRITTERPDPILPNKFAWVDIVPPRYGREQGNKFGGQPVGTGPYKFVSWKRGSEVVVDANQSWWGGKVPFDRVVFRIVPDASTRTAMLLAGEADIVPFLEPDVAELVGRSPRAKVVGVFGVRKMLLVIGPGTTPLQDSRVRKALNYAIDRDTIIQRIFLGHAKKTNGTVHSMIPGHVDQLDGFYDFNPGKARELLVTAGYPSGFPIDMYTPVGTFPKDKEAAEAIAEQLRQVGLRVNLVTMEWGKFFSQLASMKMQGLSYMRAGNSVGDASEPYTFSIWSKGVRPYVVDSRIDQMYETAQSTVDFKRRTSLFRELERHVITEVVPFVFLYEMENLYGLSQRVVWTPTPEELINLRNASMP